MKSKVQNGIKKLAIFGLLLGGVIISSNAFAQSYNYVAPYVRSNGTYVQGHYKTAPDGNPFNNWSTQGNTNPFTGSVGYKNPYQPSSYNSYKAPTNFFSIGNNED